MTDWPLTLPQDPLVEGLEEIWPDMTLRTEMDAGVDKVRLLFTGGADDLNLVFDLLKPEVAILRSFWETDLSFGALPFNFTHPRLQTSVSLRFKVMPRIRLKRGAKLWFAACGFEVLP